MDVETIGYIVLFVCLLLMDAMFCGFIALIHSFNSVDIEKNQEALGEKLTAKLRKIEENEISYENRALIAVVVITGLLGGFFLPKIFIWCCDFVLANRSLLPGFMQVAPEALISGLLFAFIIFVGF